jgi:hypothetical protein
MDEISSKIVDMMYTKGPIPAEDEECLLVLERLGNRIQHKKQSHTKRNSSSLKGDCDDKSKHKFKENKRTKIIKKYII